MTQDWLLNLSLHREMDIRILSPTRQGSVPTRPLNLSGHTCSQFRRRFHPRDFTETWLQCVFLTPLLHPGNTQTLFLILFQSSLLGGSWRVPARAPSHCIRHSPPMICRFRCAVRIYFSAPSFCVLRSSRRVLVPGLDANAINEDGIHKNIFLIARRQYKQNTNLKKNGKN